MLNLTELCCTLLSYASLIWATMDPLIYTAPTKQCSILLSLPAPSELCCTHPTELSCITLRYPKPSELGSTLLSYTALYWATHPILLCYAAPYWATLHPSQLCCTLLSNKPPTGLLCTILCNAASCCTLLHPSELHCTLLSWVSPFWVSLQPQS